jgi:hypothetical protein
VKKRILHFCFISCRAGIKKRTKRDTKLPQLLFLLGTATANRRDAAAKSGILYLIYTLNLKPAIASRVMAAIL